jgi:hypothetical protein
MNFRTVLSIIGLVVGLLGITLTIIFFAIQRSESVGPSLELRMTSSTKLAPPSNPLEGRLTVYFDGKPVVDLWLTTLRLANTGNSDIGEADFSEPLIFSTGTTSIEEIIVPTGEGQENLSPQVSRTPDATSFAIEPMLLKRGEAVHFSIISKTVLSDIGAPTRVPIKDVQTINVVPLPFGVEPMAADTSIRIVEVGAGVLVAIISSLLAVLSFVGLQSVQRMRGILERISGKSIIEGVQEHTNP